MNEKVERIYKQILFICDPVNHQCIAKGQDPIFSLAFDLFFGEEPKKKSNFKGGINDAKNTLHENIFHALFPDLKMQVHFGTGKGGYEKYLAKRYTADFYDKDSKTIYEIDGNSHKEELRIIKDKIRDYFFWHELGIRTIRITNKRVESMLLERLEKVCETN